VTKADYGTLRADVKADNGGLRAEMVSEFALVRSEMELLRRDLTIRMGGMFVVAIGVLLTAMRFMVLHP
jgi:hypothetical protein